MAVFEDLHDARRKFAATVFVGIAPDVGRKQRHIIDADVPVALEDHDQPAQFRLLGLDRGIDFDPFPVIAGQLDLCLCRERRAGTAHKDLRLALEAEFFHPHTEVVYLALFERHAVIVPVAHRISRIFHAVNAAHAHDEVGRVGRAHASVRGDIMRACPENIPVLVLHLPQLHGNACIVPVVVDVLKLERVVDDHFGVQATVRRLVDVLKKQAVQMFADGDPLFGFVQTILNHARTLS